MYVYNNCAVVGILTMKQYQSSLIYESYNTEILQSKQALLLLFYKVTRFVFSLTQSNAVNTSNNILCVYTIL